eukprot:2215540-Rhodomonas_salina.2
MAWMCYNWELWHSSFFSAAKEREEIGWQLQKRYEGVGISSLASLDAGSVLRLAGSYKSVTQELVSFLFMISTHGESKLVQRARVLSRSARHKLQVRRECEGNERGPHGD